MHIISRIMLFLKEGVWSLKVKALSPFKAFWIKFLRIILLIRQALARNLIQEGAATLTYYTLLSLVPTFVIILGVAKGFGLEKWLITFILQKFSSQEEVLSKLIEIGKSSLNGIRTDIIGAIGLIVLLWAVVKIVMQLETSLNNIWEVKKKRNLSAKFSDYLAVLFFSPIIIIIANGLIFYLSSKVHLIKEQEIDSLLFTILNILPFLLTSSLFLFIYMFLPNTRVKLKPALYGALIAGALYQIFQWIYLVFQIGASSYSVLYGTFAAIPFFIAWVHISWVIMLLGSKIAFAFQNVEAYEFVTEDFRLSHRSEQILALRLVHDVIKRFSLGKAPPTSKELSESLFIPLLITEQILQILSELQLLISVKREDREDPGYLPCHDPADLTIKEVLDMIEARGKEIFIPSSGEAERILESLKTFSILIDNSPANIPLKDI